MQDSSSNQHAGRPAPENTPAGPEPSYADRARTLVHLGRVGSLSTLSRKQPGWPFGSVMPYAVDEHGRPVVLISSMAMHTQNLARDPRASLLVTQPEASGDPLGASRVTLLGNVAQVSGEDSSQARAVYLSRHENARYWVDFSDFAFYHMEVVDVYFVGGFGVMGWVAADEYTKAEPDPLADAAHSIISHMNSDHAAALVLLASAFAQAESDEAVMTSVDRLGFHVRLMAGDRVHGARIPFLREVHTTEEARAVLIEMVRQANARQ